MLIGKITFEKIKNGKVTNVKKLREVFKIIKLYTKFFRNPIPTEKEIGEYKTEAELLSKMIVISMENCFANTNKPIDYNEVEELFSKLKDAKTFFKFISEITEVLSGLVIDYSVFYTVPKSDDLRDKYLAIAKEIRRLANSCYMNVIRIMHEEAGKKYQLGSNFLYVDYPLENLSNMYSYLVNRYPELASEEARAIVDGAKVAVSDPVYEMFLAKFNELLEVGNRITQEESRKLKEERAFDWLLEKN